MSGDKEKNDYPLADLRSQGEDFNWGEPAQPAATNPVELVTNGLYGRLRWAILLAAILSPIFILAGYFLGPVKYEATSVLSVATPEPLVAPTLENNESLGEAFANQQVQLILNAQVLYAAIADDDLVVRYQEERPNYAVSLINGINAYVPRNSTSIIVSMQDEDPRFVKDAVNAVVKAYRAEYGLNGDLEYQAKVRQVDGKINGKIGIIEDEKRKKIRLIRESEYAFTDLEAIRSSLVEQILRKQDAISAIDSELALIKDDHEDRVRALAAEEGREPEPSELLPEDSDCIPPTDEDLFFISNGLAASKQRLEAIRREFSLADSNFGSGHTVLRKLKANLRAEQEAYTKQYEEALETWETNVGRTRNWGSLVETKARLGDELEGLIERNSKLATDQIIAENSDATISFMEEELGRLVQRREELIREKASISSGRVELVAEAVTPQVPKSNRKVAAAVGGFLAAIGLSFGGVFLLGTLDQKTFGVRQLQAGGNSLRMLGVMPNMDEVESDTETVTLATDCVHRIRGRIESRRAPESGYAMMVSSPFQGDGKTTLAVSLGWSYAESGYKTLLIDADFIGRSMTHQFGHLKDAGLREIVRNGAVGDEIHELGHANLSLLGVGFDRRISAANLSPRLMSRVLEAVRGDYDIIIVDSGPMTASIEAMPVAAAVDGVVLALRRGRSRGRLLECIQDIRSVGADYLGVVLNYADRSDCMKHGSTSRMSMSVQAALDGEGDERYLGGNRNPLLGDLSEPNR